ncbi:hypothetical protein ACIQCG_24055 [Streptomyces noursei]
MRHQRAGAGQRVREVAEVLRGSWCSSYGVRAAGIAERLMGVALGSA